MAMRRGYSRGPRSPRRRTSWEEGPASGSLGNGQSTSLTSTGLYVIGAGATVLEDGITLTRIRGDLLAATVVGSAGHVGALGLCVVDENAFAIGATALPGPISDADWDGWLWWMALQVEDVSTTARPDTTVQRRQVDSRAQRKLTEGDVICMMAEVTQLAAGSTAVYFDSRMLVKLP